MDAWEQLISGSLIASGDAWEHLLAQGGGSGPGETVMVLIDNVEIEMSTECLEVELDLTPIAAEVETPTLVAEIADTELIAEICHG